MCSKNQCITNRILFDKPEVLHMLLKVIMKSRKREICKISVKKFDEYSQKYKIFYVVIMQIAIKLHDARRITIFNNAFLYLIEFSWKS